MTDEKTTQTDRDQTQANLDAKLGQLKELITDKVEAVERPFQWLHANALPLLIGAGAAMLLLSLTRRD